jgi:RNA polymerase sigma factor (sigma-70 family)
MRDPEDELIPTRQSLLSRIKDWKDGQGWQEFFEIYWKLIYRTARKAGLDHAAAEEVVQETVIAVARKIPEFTYDPKIGSFKGWLLQLTRWKIIDQFRQRKDTIPFSAEEEGFILSQQEGGGAGVEHDLSSIWEEEWEKNLLESAMERVKARIDPRQFQIFDMYVLQMKPVRQISQALGINPARIYLAKHRVSKLLAAELKRLKESSPL